MFMSYNVLQFVIESCDAVSKVLTLSLVELRFILSCFLLICESLLLSL